MLTTMGGTIMPMPKHTPDATSTDPFLSVVSMDTEP